MMAKKKRKSEEIEDGSWVSIDEQEQQGLRRPRKNEIGKFVPSSQKQEIIRLPDHPAQNTYAEITPSVKSVVEVRTSHVDRAKGFNIAITPLAFVVGVFAIMYAIAFKDYPLLSAATGMYFFTWFSICWVLGYVLSNIVLTPEFAGLLDVLFKWLYLFKERNDTWRHYRGKK